MKKTNQPDNLCDQCQQQQSDSLWLVFAIGFIIGVSAAAISAWIIVGIFHP